MLRRIGDFRVLGARRDGRQRTVDIEKENEWSTGKTPLQRRREW